MRNRTITWLMFPLMAILFSSGCRDMLWPFENPDDVYRCDPDCPGGQVCRNGECVAGRTEGGMILDGGGKDQKVVQVPGTWVTIKAGTFKMGSPTNELCHLNNETQHDVTLTHKFEMQTTEVTQDQFFAVMGYEPWKFTTCGGTCPVEYVRWYEAAAYANALSAKAGLTKCYTCSGSNSGVTCQETTATQGKGIYSCPGYRLPTEAEWEYAYRAGSTTAFHNGGITSCTGKDSNLEKIGWYYENSGSTPHPVGKKTPNAWGLYDMAGNVWEWCHDWYTTYPTTSVTDPVGTSGSYRVFRGGSWYDDAQSARAAYRYDDPPGSRGYYLGFRLVRSVP